ncbi:hypothetical protein K9B32_26415 [Rhizobium sp. 3T7]|uniref:hypothetical protein n=1 Tax=Rhizobium sp. 3T7 TaxID=2874922 RepID=UPI001CCD7722|nr:hypothetical protein [Rhizobium sp. 3T7]MBZ9793595.1 hypothetical protein [Rhizobium sp. 3T7]
MAKEVSPQQLQQMAGDGETVIPSLPKPVDRLGFGQCLGADEVEARENPSGLAATIYQAALEPDIRQQL